MTELIEDDARYKLGILLEDIRENTRSYLYCQSPELLELARGLAEDSWQETFLSGNLGHLGHHELSINRNKESTFDLAQRIFDSTGAIMAVMWYRRKSMNRTLVSIGKPNDLILLMSVFRNMTFPFLDIANPDFDLPNLCEIFPVIEKIKEIWSRSKPSFSDAQYRGLNSSRLLELDYLFRGGSPNSHSEFYLLGDIIAHDIFYLDYNAAQRFFNTSMVPDKVVSFVSINVLRKALEKYESLKTGEISGQIPKSSSRSKII